MILWTSQRSLVQWVYFRAYKNRSPTTNFYLYTRERTHCTSQRLTSPAGSFPRLKAESLTIKFCRRGNEPTGLVGSIRV